MARQKHKIEKRNWLVTAPLRTMIVPAGDEDEARQKMLEAHRLGSKPYLARDWIVREATAEEIEHYAIWADNWRPSQTPERQAIEARRSGRDRRMSVQERLV